VSTGIGQMLYRGFDCAATGPWNPQVNSPFGKNGCRCGVMLEYEAILYLRHAVVAGSLSEVYSLDLKFNAMYHLAEALFEYSGEAVCIQCPGVAKSESLKQVHTAWGLTRAQAISELKSIAVQFSTMNAGFIDFKNDGWIPSDISALDPFLITADFLETRELISPSTPSLGASIVKRHHVWSLFWIKLKDPKKAVNAINDLLENVNNFTGHGTPRSKFESFGDDYKKRLAVKACADPEIPDEVLCLLDGSAPRSVSVINSEVLHILNSLKQTVDEFHDSYFNGGGGCACAECVGEWTQISEDIGDVRLSIQTNNNLIKAALDEM
jgi:hypothetical protein